MKEKWHYPPDTWMSQVYYAGVDFDDEDNVGNIIEIQIPIRDENEKLVAMVYAEGPEAKEKEIIGLATLRANRVVNS